MAQQLCHTPKVNPISNESVLRVNLSFEQTYKRVVGNDAEKDEKLTEDIDSVVALYPLKSDKMV